MTCTRRFLLSVPAVLSLAVLLPASGAAELPDGPVAPAAAPVRLAHAGEDAYDSLPTLPEGDGERGAAGVARSAIALAATLRAVPVSAGSDRVCPRERLSVAWDEPGSSYGHGAFVEPLGPAPTTDTSEVNGVIVCEGSRWAFMGFEARWAGRRWDVVAVPFVSEAHEPGEVHEEQEVASSTPSTAAADAPAPPPAAPSTFGAEIDGYARYEPQRTCSPSPKPGTAALKALLLGGAPGSRNLGISRACHIGGSSEHKEGRAFDWGVLVSRPAEAAAAERFLGQLLATDEHGNRHALARRMGVMYVIWDRQIWSAHRPDEGWRRYSGPNAHTDHVHLSLSWDGALGRTSYWSGATVAGLSFVAGPGTGTAPVVAGPVAPPTDGGGGDPAGTGEGRARRPVAGGGAVDAERTAAEQEAHRQAKAAQDEARRQAKAAEDEARRQERAAAEEAHRQAKAAEDEARRQERAAAEEAHRQAKAAEEAARRQQRAIEDQAREQRRQAAAPVPAPRSAPAASSGGGGGGGGHGHGGGGHGGGGKGKG